MTIQELEKLKPCDEGLEYVKEKESIRKAWEDSERGDWMLWYANKAGADIRAMTLAKAKCVRLVEHLMRDDRSKKTLDVAERFGKGEATRDELDEARNAAASAVFAADTTDAATDADYAYDAAVAAIDAAYAKKKRVRSQCADICREVLTDELFGTKNTKDND